jgi:hypothetical protein
MAKLDPIRRGGHTGTADAERDFDPAKHEHP